MSAAGLVRLLLLAVADFPRLRATIVEHPKVVPFARDAVKHAKMQTGASHGP
jgi:hypothetical protein